MREEGDIKHAYIWIDTCALKKSKKDKFNYKKKENLPQTFLQSFDYHVFVVLDNFLQNSSKNNLLSRNIPTSVR